ncbi:hypothetical protein [Spirosoma flavum]|uniref:Transketolase N-terminal domain-containing protein n=1 Tax=Spirosoma flavum TaxID=2048557 RepID=A0ABW6AKS7_9BACT
MPHRRLDNLIAIVDVNGQQIDGPTDVVLNNRDLGKKYDVFGWNVLHMDGNKLAIRRTKSWGNMG